MELIRKRHRTKVQITAIMIDMAAAFVFGGIWMWLACSFRDTWEMISLYAALGCAAGCTLAIIFDAITDHVEWLYRMAGIIAIYSIIGFILSMLSFQLPAAGYMLWASHVMPHFIIAGICLVTLSVSLTIALCTTYDIPLRR